MQASQPIGLDKAPKLKELFLKVFFETVSLKNIGIA